MKMLTSNDKQHALVSLVAVSILIAASLLIATQTLLGNREPPIVAVRIDDVQDFYCRDAQFILFEYSLNNSIPATLAIIPRFFGQDKELVDAVKSVTLSGFEVAVHGWEHEDLTRLSLEEQQTRLQQGKAHLSEVLSVNASVLVPPMFSYNNDTLVAMHTNGLKIVSGLSELQPPAPASEGIISIPATVELSDFANGTWKMKSADSVTEEVNASIHLHGYAVIVTHPQEFMKDGALSREALQEYNTLIQTMKPRYSFTTLDGLARGMNIEPDGRVTIGHRANTAQLPGGLRQGAQIPHMIVPHPCLVEASPERTLRFLRSQDSQLLHFTLKVEIQIHFS